MKNSEERILRALIREHVLSAAVPDFVLTSALDKTTDSIRREMLKYIQAYKSQDPETHANAMRAMETLIEGLRADIKEAFEQRMLDFMQSI